MKTKNAIVVCMLALCAMQVSAANTHTVTFRRLNGTILKTFEVQHGANATSLAPEIPAETGMTAQRWDHAEWLADGRNDVTYGVLATESLDDWAHATFVPYSDFTEGTLTPSAVKNPAPAQMFFKYSIEIQ